MKIKNTYKIIIFFMYLKSIFSFIIIFKIIFKKNKNKNKYKLLKKKRINENNNSRVKF